MDNAELQTMSASARSASPWLDTELMSSASPNRSSALAAQHKKKQKND